MAYPLHAIAAVVAMLEDERSPPCQSHGPHSTSARTCRTGRTRESCANSGEESEPKNAKHVSAGASREPLIGNAVRADLDVEVLQTKRRRLVQLSKDVLEVRCPGFCAMASLSEEDYLREASCALSDISRDVDVAICALGDAADCIPWSRDM